MININKQRVATAWGAPRARIRYRRGRHTASVSEGPTGLPDKHMHKEASQLGWYANKARRTQRA